jgi:hypothetical protein
MRTIIPLHPARWIPVVGIAWITLITATVTVATEIRQEDRLWLISTRAITSNVRCADLDQPALDIRRLFCDGRSTRASLEDYLAAVNEQRSVVIYIHGNRMQSQQATVRGLRIYRECTACQQTGPIDWVIWSWPSEQEGILAHDARRKAERTDAQSLYLGWLLSQQEHTSNPTTLIGYSFGGRIASGALHALAGGEVDGRTLHGPPRSGLLIGVGLLAPAIDSHSLTTHGDHHLATQNMHSMVLMYNHRDRVLKRYWLIDRVRGRLALGYSGPTSFGPRADGSALPVRARDCSSSIGPTHDELDYFSRGCRAGAELAALINDIHRNR